MGVHLNRKLLRKASFGFLSCHYLIAVVALLRGTVIIFRRRVLSPGFVPLGLVPGTSCIHEC